MRKTVPKSVSAILKKSSKQLRDILTHQALLAKYQSCINTLLDSRLQQHCQISNVRGKQLILQCSSAAWAARARLHAPAILHALNQQFACGLQDYKIVTRPVSNSPVTTKARRMKLSSTSRELLATTASTTTDPELAAALLRLSRSGKSN